MNRVADIARSKQLPHARLLTDEYEWRWRSTPLRLQPALARGARWALLLCFSRPTGRIHERQVSAGTAQHCQVRTSGGLPYFLYEAKALCLPCVCFYPDVVLDVAADS